jgi:hypothetical protein
MLERYGSYCDIVCSMTWGFRLILFWSFFAMFFLLLALFASYQSVDQQQQLQKKHQQTAAHHKKGKLSRRVGEDSSDSLRAEEVPGPSRPIGKESERGRSLQSSYLEVV